ncbi:MAG: hypothetical protein ACNA8W_22485 [Bradymonadaceae bacterium]
MSTVTICGFVRPETHFNSDAIADHYLRIHHQPRQEWAWEFQYRWPPGVAYALALYWASHGLLRFIMYPVERPYSLAALRAASSPAPAPGPLLTSWSVLMLQPTRSTIAISIVLVCTLCSMYACDSSKTTQPEVEAEAASEDASEEAKGNAAVEVADSSKPWWQTEKVGPLYLGMTQSEVEDALGLAVDGTDEVFEGATGKS